MKKMLFATLALALVGAVTTLSAQEKKATTEKKSMESEMPEHKVFTPSDIQWKDAPPILPAGA
jgi:hypothetical protein